jgi:Cation/multidrug efflux pump
LIIKDDGSNIVRFSDVGMAELAPEDIRSLLKKNGEPTVINVLIPQPGANHIEIADEAYRRIEQLKKDLPEDVSIEMVYDNTRFIRASIFEVEETIYVAFLLVVIIIFLFFARLACYVGSGGRYSRFTCGCLFCNVFVGFLRKRTYHACRCIVGGTCGG